MSSTAKTELCTACQKPLGASRLHVNDHIGGTTGVYHTTCYVPKTVVIQPQTNGADQVRPAKAT